EGEAVASGREGTPVPQRVVESVRRERPQVAAGEEEEGGVDRAEPPLEPRHEERHRNADREQVADVVVDERGGQVVPPWRRPREALDGAELFQGQVRAPVHDDDGRRDQDRRQGDVRALDREREAPHPLAPLAPLRRTATPPVAAGLLRGEGLAAALELRRALSEPRAAVRALGDVRTHLRTAALADDTQLRL